MPAMGYKNDSVIRENPSSVYEVMNIQDKKVCTSGVRGYKHLGYEGMNIRVRGYEYPG